MPQTLWLTFSVRAPSNLTLRCWLSVSLYSLWNQRPARMEEETWRGWGGGGGGGGGILKIVLGKGGGNFNGQLFWGGERVQFWYTTPFWTPPRPPPPGRNKRSVPKVASRYRAFSRSCDLFIRIVLNFHFEFKVLTDGNKRSEMFISSVTICLFKYDMYSCKLMFIRLSWIYSLPINLTLSPVILSAS